MPFDLVIREIVLFIGVDVCSTVLQVPFLNLMANIQQRVGWVQVSTLPRSRCPTGSALLVGRHPGFRLGRPRGRSPRGMHQIPMTSNLPRAERLGV